MKVAIYARVSTKDKGQETENQLRQLREFAKRSDHEIVLEYVENVSASGKVARPKFEEMFVAAYQKRVDLILFWSLDRFSREGVAATFNHLQRLNEYGVKWKSYTEPFLDSSGGMGEMIIAIFATIAKQERIRISERVRAGLERVKEEGSRSGNAIGRPKAIFRRDVAVALREEGKSLRDIGRALGVSPAIVHRELQGVSKPSPVALPFCEPLMGSESSLAAV